MARQRVSAAPLARLFDSAVRPLFVLDDELVIVFCNQAMRAWLGPLAAEVVGQRCLYSSPAGLSGLQAAAAALCPPPVVLEGKTATATVSRSHPEAPTLVYRRATFLPLADCSAGVLAVVGLLDLDDLAEPVSESHGVDVDETLDLHRRVHATIRESALRQGLEHLVGESPSIRRARAQAEVAAACRASVLVVGPVGSGRQRMAASIHYGREPEAAGTLVPLACALLGPDLIHSTVRALASGKPLAGQSGQSTLLLNDADQMPVEIQAEMARLFSNRAFPLRLMATTEQSLVEMARHGRFNNDLAAILSTITIELVALTERRADLPLLAQAMLEERNTQGGRQIAGFTAEALDRLDGYTWPGNLDELAQVVAESHQQAAGAMIAASDLPKRLRLAAEAAQHPRRPEETIVLDEFLAQIERELIRRALARGRGNKAKAARLLGLTRPRLYRRMVQLGLEPESP